MADGETTGGASGIAGFILAGGRGRRMGGVDKPLVRLAGRPLIAHVIARAAPQVARLAIGAAGDPARFAAFGLPVVADPAAEAGVESFAGPLAGLLAGLDWAAGQAGIGRLAVFPADLPLLPDDFVARSRTALANGAEWACAASGGRLHPVVALWPVGVAERLRRLVAIDGLRRVDRLADWFRLATVDYAADPIDPFFNVNTPDDLAAAERLLR